MRRYLVASFIVAFSALPGGIVMAGGGYGTIPATAGYGKAQDACPPSIGSEYGLPGGSSAHRAIGLVARATDTAGRFAVDPIEGTFHPGAKVSIYTLNGERVGTGAVHSVYDDDLYVDAFVSPGNIVRAGSVVLMNFSDRDAAVYIRAARGTLASSASETRKETARMQREIADEARANLANREKWQEEMTKMRMQLDFQYPSYYWGGYSYYYR